MARVTHEQKVLALLNDGQPHSHMEGYRLGVMLHSRVAGLRKKGYGIVCDKSNREYVYTLVSRPLAESGQADTSLPGVVLVPTCPVPDSASGATAGSSVQFLGCASGLNSPTDEPHGAVPLDLLTVEPDGQLALVAA